MSSRKFICILSLCFFSYSLYAQNSVDSIIDQGVERISENKKSQQKIDASHEKTLLLIEQYQDDLKILDGLIVYNKMMSRQLDRQTEEIKQLRHSINNVSIIERQIPPLLHRMLNGLEEFVQLDVPFLIDERRNRVSRLRTMLERVDVSVAEKSRRVFEAYQIEVAYGRTIEAYRSKLNVGNGVFDVDFLRVGRTALLYRTLGEEKMGYWNKNLKKWSVLDGSNYRRYFDLGIQIARKELAPDLISVPVVIGGENETVH